jgi:hypothetical protein
VPAPATSAGRLRCFAKRQRVPRQRHGADQGRRQVSRDAEQGRGEDDRDPGSAQCRQSEQVRPVALMEPAQIFALPAFKALLMAGGIGGALVKLRPWWQRRDADKIRSALVASERIRSTPGRPVSEDLAGRVASLVADHELWSQIQPCWHEHPGVVAELAVLADWHDTLAASEATVPQEWGGWYDYLGRALERLSRSPAAKCTVS